MTATSTARHLTRSSKVSTAALLMVLTLVAMLVASPVAASSAAQQQREERRTFAAREGIELDLENLVGEVVVEGTAGSEIEVIATIHAADGDRADAQTLLELLQITFDESGDGVNVRADYPVGRFDVYRYPPGSSNSETTYDDERVRVTSRDDDEAVTLYVDFVVRVPAGVATAIENNVGNVSASGLRGDFRGDTGSGDVTIREVTGDVEADTGSGDVHVEGVTGEVSVDTGSGDAEIRDVTGDVAADTGSGNVELYDVRADRIEADTGSGDVHMERVSGDVAADTGSGDIVVRDLAAGAGVSADTGSGDVRLSGDFSGVRQIEIDVSSGDVEIEMTAYPGMSMTIETGSGDIDVDLPDLRTETSRRNYFRGTTGDGAADVNIDAGSGSVRIRGS